MNTQSPLTLHEAVPVSIASPILPAVLQHTAQKVFEEMGEKLRTALNGRDERALQLALNGNVSHKSGRIYSVRSADGLHSYLVDLEKRFCTCPDSQKGNACKHRLAAYLVEQASQATQADPNQQKPTELNPKKEPEIPHLTPDEEALEKARLLFHARSQYLRESIIYAQLPMDGQMLPVEIIELEGEVALVRALPQLVDGNLIPQFPFPGKQSAAQVIAKSLTDIRIYR